MVQVGYQDHGPFPMNKEKLYCVLGPSMNEENQMAQNILMSTGHVIPRRTLRKLRVNELHSESEKRKRRWFDEIIQKKLGNSINFPPVVDPIKREFEPYSDDDDPDSVKLPEENDPVDSEGIAVF